MHEVLVIVQQLAMMQLLVLRIVIPCLRSWSNPILIPHFDTFLPIYTLRLVKPPEFSVWPATDHRPAALPAITRHDRPAPHPASAPSVTPYHIEMAARPFSTRDRVARVTPICFAASVTDKPIAGSTSSRSVAPGYGGLCILVIFPFLNDNPDNRPARHHYLQR